MRRLAFVLSVLALPGFLALPGCTDQEPLSPAFAGEWSSAKRGCGGPRIVINRTGISASGMPINGMTFTSSSVSGSTAHVVMEVSSAARFMSQAPKPTGKPNDLNPADLEVVATLIASSTRVHPTNVIFRHKGTRQLQAAHEDVLAVMTLIRCKERSANDRGPGGPRA